MIDSNDLRVKVQAAIQDEAEKLDTSAIDACIAEAISGRYSQARPRDIAADIAGDGVTFQWELNPTRAPGWQEAFSVITQIEYPADQRPAAYLDEEEYFVRTIKTPDPGAQATGIATITGTPATGDTVTVRMTTDGGVTSTTATYTALSTDALFEFTVGLIAAINASAMGSTIQATGGQGPLTLQAVAIGVAGNNIQFKVSVTGGAIAATPTAYTALTGGTDPAYRWLSLTSTTPATGAKLRMFYSSSHLDGSTVPAVYFFALMNLAAGLCCSRLVGIYNQAGDSALSADAVDYRGKSSQYATMQKNFDLEFQKLMGTDKATAQPAASSTKTWNEETAIGWDRLMH